MKILITGFDPFGGEAVNPSIETVRLLPEKIAGADLIKLEIPTSFRRALPAIEKAIEKYDPDVILSVGQAGGNAAIAVERVGINLSDARIPDNDGFQPMDEPIAADGPAAYFTTIPTRRIVERLRRDGIPAVLSYSAGTFVCNQVTYGVCRLLATRFPQKQSGFLHIPYLPSQVADRPQEPSMSQDMLVAALTAAAETIAAAWQSADRPKADRPEEILS